MKLLKVAAGVLNQTPLAWDSNKRNIVTAIAEARAAGVSLLCLPELCITGYGCEDAFHSLGVQRTALEVLHEILPETRGMIVSVGLPLAHGGGLFNTACLIVDGQIAGFVGKQNLAGEGIHYEPRWFKSWPNNVRVEVDIRGRRVPLGDVMFDVGGVLMGFEICEDAWVATRPGSELALHGADVILNPSASHFAFGKQDVRTRFVLEGSRAFNVSYLYANLLGNEAGRAIYDGGAIIASAGRLLATGPRFSYRDFHLTTATIDIDATRMTRARTGSYRPELVGIDSQAVRVPFDFTAAAPSTSTAEVYAWEKGPSVKEEEFGRAVMLALFDYLRKSRSGGFVVSLSGGADSSTVALLCALLVKQCVAEIGREAFLHKLAHLPRLSTCVTERELVASLLTTVYQATKNSGPVTQNAAKTLAAAIGATHLDLNVDTLYDGYVNLISQAIGRPLSWEKDDLALQNIQARVRSPSVWLLANLAGALLLSTSNRSEAAVGYATMDGDTSGGLCPIAGIDKAFVRRWLRWMEETGLAGIGPIAALSVVNDQQPTAELRPPSAMQTDEADLMPYEILDAIERLAIRDKLVPLEVLQSLSPQYPQYTREQLAFWIDRFFKLWCRNQWKRERYAPSFHLDDENLDPKTWCRFPILSGGYERELSEMHAWVKTRS
jgi:NAD+ synthase (glutamine-hydrolysing)